jgi:cation-transporting P-type ATPase E
VVPAAIVSSLMGLLLFVAILFLGVNVDGRSVAEASGMARTALTSFLVGVGLLLVIYVEPPVEWLAVAEPLAPDWRPTWLAIGLGIGYVVTLLVPAGREFFQFVVPEPREAAIVLVLVTAWFFAVRLVWKRRIVQRFLGF